MKSKSHSFLVVLTIFCAVGLISSCTKNESNRQKLNFNADWKFYRGELEPEAVMQADYDDSGWENVHLPHAPKITPLHFRYPLNNRGVNWYRKQFQLPGTYRDKKVFIEFEGADQVADVWFNGVKLLTHSGSFSPFWVDITDHSRFGGQKNLLCVRVNNFPNRDIPVYGNWVGYGGLYRDAWLHIMNPLHITDAVQANKVAGGGIFVTYPSVSDSVAEVQIRTHIRNENDTAKKCRLLSAIVDKNQRKVGSAAEVQIINGGANHTFAQTIRISRPQLWHPDHPNLYTLISQVYDDNDLVDVQKTRIGIRRIAFSKDNGFSINGQRLIFMGTNRVQDYPYVAWAFPNTAQKRDARHLKEAGFQYVRLSHNFQDPSFLDACDELGILMMAPIPGFQFIGGQEFREHSFRNMRELIRCDRNHPCVILWELSLNETDFDSSFAQQAMKIGHEEFPGDQCFISGWKFDNIYDVYIRASQHGARNYAGNAPLVISEYGHWDYGGGNSTSDVSRQDGEEAMLTQARNHQESLNANRALPFLCGDGLWVGIDYQIFPSGVMDFFRLPKFSYYFYQSQRDPNLRCDDINSGPMVFIANYWTENSPKAVKVFSNCDSVQLLANGKSIATQSPDQDSISNDLLHPPFTFEDVSWQPGELKAIGFLGGKPAAQFMRQTPAQAQAIRIQFELDKPEANGEEMFFVYAKIVDTNGTSVHSADSWIDFEVDGEARLISPKHVQAEAGIASALIRVSQTPGTISVKASTAELPGAEESIASRASNRK